jgi:putative transcriptional regulator
MSDILADRRESHRPVTAMMRVRLKADGRIVEIMPDGSERALSSTAAPSSTNGNGEAADAAYARGVRARTKLTQAEFAARIGVPIETVRNWEQGKRSPRGPARALLKVIDKAPQVAFAVLSTVKAAEG